MSDTINRIVFEGVDRGAESTITRLRNSARELAREMVADARKQVDSATQVVNVIREQIRAIEQRNRTDTSLQRLQLERQRQSGEITNDQFAQRQRELVTSAREDNAQVQILREILTQLVTDAEEQSRQSSIPDADPDDEIDRLQRALAMERRSQMGRGSITEDDSEEASAENINRRRGRSIQSYAQSAASQGGQILTSSNEIFAAAAMVSLIPIVGSALSSFFNKALQEGAQLEQARGGLQGLTTRSVQSQGAGASAFGVNMAEFTANYATQAARAQGSVQGSEAAGMDLLMLQRSMGIDLGQSTAMMRTLRDNNSDIMDVIGSLYQTLVDQRITDSKDFTMVGEYLAIANDIARQQLVQFGEVNDERNTALIASLAKVAKTPEALQPLINALNQGLQSPSTPLAQAFQYSVLSNINPNASRIELMKMQERGLAQPGLLSGMMSQFGSIAGNNQDLFVEQIKAMFPQLSFAMAQNLVDKFQKGDLQGIDSLASEIDGDTMRRVLGSRAGVVTGQLTAMTAEQDNAFALGGTKLIGSLNGLTQQLGGTEGMITGLLNASSGIINGMTSLISVLQSFGNFANAQNLPIPNMANGGLQSNTVRTGRENK